MFLFYVILILKLVLFHNCLSQPQQQEETLASSACEILDSADTGLIQYKACLTEAQQLFRSRIVQRQLTVTPSVHTCGDPPAQFCRLVSTCIALEIIINHFVIINEFVVNKSCYSAMNRNNICINFSYFVIRNMRGSVIPMMHIWGYMHVCISHDYKYTMYI